MGIAAISFETARLQAVAVTVPTAEFVRDLDAILTQDVLAHVPPPLRHVSSASDWIATRLQESDVLQINEISSGKSIGLILLARFGDDVHLGYLLGKDVWGKGYASEMLQGLLPELRKSGACRVIGGVSKDNPASARVLVKSGFKPGKDSDDGMTHYVWPAPDK
ncbi:MAG: GNAT family N-acetyltransferase [Silicimonas sp.]|nr:GNAT family N-acetyltransferase [Silicimonas sp.]